MVDWWGLAHNALWVIGLAIALGTLGVARYQARMERVRLRDELSQPGFQAVFSAALALFCLGLLFGAREWWQRAAWGVLALLSTAQVAWLWWQARGTRRAAAAADRPRLSRRARAAGCALVLVGVLVIAGAVVMMGMQALDRARSLQSHLQALEATAGGGVTDLDAGLVKEAGVHLAGMHGDLSALHSMAAPFLPLCRYLGWLPEHGGDVAAAADLLDVALGTVTAGDRVFRALSPAVDALAGPDGKLQLSLDAAGQALPVVVAAQPELIEAQRELAAAQAARACIDQATLSPRVAGLVVRLDRYLPWFEMAVDGALAAPALLGADGARTYLVVAQNNHELRATGGFISGVGQLRVDRGRLVSLDFADSYAVDNFSVPHDLAPADLRAILWGEMLLFRDANWHPDLPTSARRLLDIYARDQGVQADGVIALDLTALELLVGAVGPITVQGVDAPVTGANVVQIVQRQWGETGGGDWWQHRKDFMGEIAGAALERVKTGEGLDPVRLARAVQQALDEKHVLVYVDDARAANLLRRQNWDGALARDFAGDSLLVVDSNVGFNKVDANVSRAIEYEVDLETQAGPRTRLTLTYQNLSKRVVGACVQEARYGDDYVDMMDRCYWDYVRVYVPSGSELVAGPEIPLPGGSLLARLGPTAEGAPANQKASEVSLPGPVLEDTWHAVWTSFFALDPLDTTMLTFEYELPVSTVECQPEGVCRYRLVVQKQPGTGAVPFELVVKLPPGAEIVRTLPAGEFQHSASSLELSTDLRQDLAFEVYYTEGVGKP